MIEFSQMTEEDYDSGFAGAEEGSQMAVTKTFDDKEVVIIAGPDACSIIVERQTDDGMDSVEYGMEIPQRAAMAMARGMSLEELADPSLVGMECLS